MRDMTIGRAAARAGVSVDTIRYYERVGVLPRARRRASGYRVYDQATVERITLVKRLQALSLSLADIEAMLAAVGDEDEAATCARGSRRIERAIERVEVRIAELERVRNELRVALGRCARGECDLARCARTSGLRRSGRVV